MPKLSITTPLHAAGNAYIEEAYASLVAQSMSDWEWVVLQNRGGKLPDAICADVRVRCLTDSEILPASGIGRLKRRLSEEASCDGVVELDADDILHPTALAKVADALVDADFVYSDFAEFKIGANSQIVSAWGGYPYGAAYGWSGYAVPFKDSTVVAMRSPELTAHNIRLVDWAPNHVRAWSKKAYLNVGGHNTTLTVADDHDLIVRMFLAGARFKHIPECLYYYRVHEANTVLTQNAAIREGTWRVYNERVWALAEKWCADHKLARIDLCGGHDSPKGYLSMDLEGGDLVCDLEKPWPLEDSSVGVLRANDAVEHISNPIHTMNEAFRVLAPGGWLMISVPSTNGLGAFCDPSHLSFWNKLSFRYYTDPNFTRYIRGFKGRFQTSRVLEWFPSGWHKQENVPYVEAHLFAAKDGFRAMGEYLWPKESKGRLEPL